MKNEKGVAEKLKPNTLKYSRNISIPEDVSKRYMEYCRVTKMKLSEPLRVMVLESLPQLRNAENLDDIIRKTKRKELRGTGDIYAVRLPDEAVKEIKTYLEFFHLGGYRNHFMYFLIEEELLKKLKDVLRDE